MKPIHNIFYVMICVSIYLALQKFDYLRQLGPLKTTAVLDPYKRGASPITFSPSRMASTFFPLRKLFVHEANDLSKFPYFL